MAINFFTEGISYNLKQKRKIKNWINHTILEEGHKPGELNIILTSDDYLLKINQDYLKHDNYTDIITFPIESSDISGELFISIDRVAYNSKILQIPYLKELHRVIIHGILHLCGYSDKTSAKKNIMRNLEDKYLAILDVPRGTSN